MKEWFWRAPAETGWQRDVAARSTNSFHRVTDTRAHNIHLRNPDMVIDTIGQLVMAVGEQKQ